MRTFLPLYLICLLFALVACGERAPKPTSAPAPGADQAVALAVYKSPSCGCCGDWMAHLDERGFATQGHHPDDMDALKTEKGVPQGSRSCHTAVSADGYVFEGHVPARYIHQFLAAPPAGALGLSVPGMPLGSPGMEVDDRFQPYDILLLRADGSSEVFASIDRYEDQFVQKAGDG